MKLAAFQLQALHLSVTDLAAGGIFASIEPAGDFQSLGGGGSGGQINDSLIVAQWLAAPGRGVGRKEAGVHLVSVFVCGLRRTHPNRPSPGLGYTSPIRR